LQDEIRALIAENLLLREEIDGMHQQADAARAQLKTGPETSRIDPPHKDSKSLGEAAPPQIVKGSETRGLLALSLADAPWFVTDLIVSLDMHGFLARVRSLLLSSGAGFKCVCLPPCVL
jgi:hypothetical protein